ncbi:hypothetical protein DFH05DRAFT_1478457 [Lentinula detonsa]|uniref:Uncharacterized protein n=1 Tax=Lentinula detonsa TaxID=2804962 RepID=A0A9W8U036_9AGAR|nr:hypothetical protein DFH05DRAFT_1478457 [Lentinula detonsa]
MTLYLAFIFYSPLILIVCSLHAFSSRLTSKGGAFIVIPQFIEGRLPCENLVDVLIMVSSVSMEIASFITWRKTQNAQ